MAHEILHVCVKIPSYVENVEKLKAKGVDTIACVYVNHGTLLLDSVRARAVPHSFAHSLARMPSPLSAR